MNKYDNLKLLVKSFNFFLQINIFGHRKTLIPIMKKLLKKSNFAILNISVFYRL